MKSGRGDFKVAAGAAICGTSIKTGRYLLQILNEYDKMVINNEVFTELESEGPAAAKEFGIAPKKQQL